MKTQPSDLPMDPSFHCSSVPTFQHSGAPAFRVLPLLSGEIEGVATEAIDIAARGSFVMEPVADEQSALLVIEGGGVIRHNAQVFVFEALSVFMPTVGRAVVEAAHNNVALLRIRMRRTPADLEILRQRPSALPYFVRYEDCAPYTEAIKSARTVSRTLVAEDVAPRFSMGSVETAGPDEVGAHEHPMLEQLFWGLPGNRCRVMADGREILFGERTLLRIPSGSRHGVRVDAGNRLRYIWMDFFMRQEDMSYLAEAHHRVDVSVRN